MDNFEEEYNRIKGLTNPNEVKNELKKKSLDFREEYRKKCRRTRNQKYASKMTEEDKKIKNEKRKEKRKANKENNPVEPEVRAITRITTPMNIETIDTTVKREYKYSKKMQELSENTLKTYGNVVKAIYKKYHNKPLSEEAEISKYLRWEKHNATKLYKENEYIIKNIKDIAENSASSLNSLYCLFSRFNTKRLKLFREAIYPYMTEYNLHYEEHRNDLEINQEEVAKISFEKADVLAIAETIENISYKVLYMLVFMMPVRRLSDYRLTIIADNEEETKDERGNWYWNNKIYINNTKNKQKIILDIPEEITKIINDIIVPARRASNDFNFLIGNYSQPYLSEAFSNLTKKIYGSAFTATDIRKIYCTRNLEKAGGVGNINEVLSNQNLCGHSLAEHINYALPNTSSS
jgi:hypothetical protein